MVLIRLLFGIILTNTYFADGFVNLNTSEQFIKHYGEVEIQILKDVAEMKREIAELRENCSTCFQQGTEKKIPGEVAFTARLSQDIHDLGIGATLVFDELLINTGNGYDQLTGIFTCPQDGLYVVTATIVVGGGGTFGGNIVKNDHILVILDANGSSISSGHYNSATALTSIYLQSGDKIWIKGRWDSPHVLLGGGYSTFSIWMI